ncbi:MAG: LysR family transcriptional regulator [Desulfurococcales archaeon]|nr:LysR family transcriptional regulator [Desulfurococcales archaeon]
MTGNPLSHKRIVAERRIILLLGGEELLDEATASLLYLVDSWGSLLKASKITGIPYSRAWERIARVERLVGAKIIERRRGGPGGGGARLTSVGRALLDRYLQEYRRLTGEPFTPRGRGTLEEAGSVIVSGSHDFLLSTAVGKAREQGVRIELHWTGSAGGLACIVMGDCDLAGIHILDPETGEYNTRAFESLGLHGSGVLIRGYDRAQGFLSRRPMSLEEIIVGLLRGELRLANRQAGSGTRILLDYLLSEWARRLGVPREEIPVRVQGYDTVYKTHLDVAEAVSRGDADVGLGLRHASKLYGLYYTHVRWEHYDLVVSRRFYESGDGRELVSGILRWARRLAGSFEGYRIPGDSGGLIIG